MRKGEYKNLVPKILLEEFKVIKFLLRRKRKSDQKS